MPPATGTPKRLAGLMAVLALVRLVLALLETILEGMAETDPERPMVARLVAHMARQEARLLGDLAAVEEAEAERADSVRYGVKRVWPTRRVGVCGAARRGLAGAVPRVARAPPRRCGQLGMMGDPLRRVLSRAHRLAKPACAGRSIVFGNFGERP